MSFNLSANENKGNWNRRIGKSQPLFVYFRPFHTQFDGIQNKKIVYINLVLLECYYYLAAQFEW